jgi:hypothetical protein
LVNEWKTWLCCCGSNFKQLMFRLNLNLNVLGTFLKFSKMFFFNHKFYYLTSKSYKNPLSTNNFLFLFKASNIVWKRSINFAMLQLVTL